MAAPPAMPATEVAELAIGSVICAIGALAIAAAAIRRPRGEPAVLWFAIFTLLYGIRLLTDSQLVRDLAQPEAAFWDYTHAAITYGILAPALRFAVSLVPGRRRPAVERVIIALWGYAAAALAVDLLHGRPGTMLWLNPFAVAVFATSLGAQSVSWARTAPWPREVRVAVAGGIVFTAFADVTVVVVGSGPTTGRIGSSRVSSRPIRSGSLDLRARRSIRLAVAVVAARQSY